MKIILFILFIFCCAVALRQHTPKPSVPAVYMTSGDVTSASSMPGGGSLLPDWYIDLEKYVEENKHLPGVPSADEVVKDGLDLGSMDAKLLQKIEELTLYVIQQQKEIEELKSKVNNK